MRTTTKTGALFGALAGAVAELGVLTGWKVFFVLSLPGSFPIVLLEGHAVLPSLKTAALNSLLYSFVGVLMARLWSSRRQLVSWVQLRRRPRPGRCPDCDYDLTGNVSGICPECGTLVPPNQAIPGVNSVSTFGDVGLGLDKIPGISALEAALAGQILQQIKIANLAVFTKWATDERNYAPEPTHTYGTTYKESYSPPGVIEGSVNCNLLPLP